MKLVVDEYPTSCKNCIFKTDNFSLRKYHCNILHKDIGTDEFNKECYDNFILYKDLMQTKNSSTLVESIINAKNKTKRCKNNNMEHDFMMTEAFGGLI